MPTTIEERVAYLEGKVEEHSYAWQDLRERITHMEQKFDQRFIQIDQRITNMEQKFDQRFIQIDQRITNMEQKFDQRFLSLEQRMDNRFEAIDQKFSKYFLWIIGIQVSVLLAVIAVMLRG